MGNAVSDLVHIEAQVQEIAPRAVRQYFEGAREQTFDAITLEVLAPSEMAGRKLQLFQRTTAGPESAESLWRSGVRLSFSIDRKLLGSGLDLYTTAVENLRPADAE